MARITRVSMVPGEELTLREGGSSSTKTMSFEQVKAAWDQFSGGTPCHANLARIQAWGSARIFLSNEMGEDVLVLADTEPLSSPDLETFKTIYNGADSISCRVLVKPASTATVLSTLGPEESLHIAAMGVSGN